MSISRHFLRIYTEHTQKVFHSVYISHIFSEESEQDDGEVKECCNRWLKSTLGEMQGESCIFIFYGKLLLRQFPSW